MNYNLQNLEVGDQIVCVPLHLRDNNKTLIEIIQDYCGDIEYGFVTGLSDSGAFCRYWSKWNSDELRTTSCSELTPYPLLWRWQLKPQRKVDSMIEAIRTGAM